MGKEGCRVLNKGVDGCVEEKFDEIRIGLGIKLTKKQCNGWCLAKLMKESSKAEIDDLGWMNVKS